MCLLKTIDAMPPSKQHLKFISGTGGKVSVEDIIAYQIGWGKALLNWYAAGLRDEVPIMPLTEFPKWNYKSIAQHFYQAYSYDGLHRQKEIFHEIVEKILEITEKEHASGNLYNLGVWNWCTLASGKQWPLYKWIKINTSAPYKKAAQLIKKSNL